tara:strand:- start:1577 stop:1975 length:399 start_codon:yes stop_codon:yes gene_type:complete
MKLSNFRFPYVIHFALRLHRLSAEVTCHYLLSKLSLSYPQAIFLLAFQLISAVIPDVEFYEEEQERLAVEINVSAKTAKMASELEVCFKCIRVLLVHIWVEVRLIPTKFDECEKDLQSSSLILSYTIFVKSI